MKKKTLLFMMVTFMSFALVLSGCNSGTKDAASPSPSEEAVAPAASTAPSVAPTEEVKDLSGTIDFWTFDETGSKLLADAFMAKYPKVTIKTSLLSWDDLPKNLQTTIAAGSGAPDVAYIEGGMFGKFVNNEGLEDLLAEPYNAARYQDQFVSGNWNRWLSLDGQKLLGFPWDQPPMVTFYRPDILEEAGYPSDPAGFGELLQDQTKVMEMAQALKAKGIFTFEFSQTPIDMLTSKVGFWDHDLNYLRNTDEFATALDLSKQIKQMGLALDQSSFWSDEGKAAMTGGKLLMVTFGTWAQGQLKDLGEDQIGKWKATNLPFGNYVGNGGSTMVIPSQAKNKELAWEFIQFSLASQEGQDAWVTGGGTTGFIPEWDSAAFKSFKSEVLGGQELNILGAELMGKVDESWVPFPMNDAANTVWGEKVKEAIEKNKDSKAALQQIQDDITKTVSVDFEKMKTQLGK